MHRNGFSYADVLARCARSFRWLLVRIALRLVLLAAIAAAFMGFAGVPHFLTSANASPWGGGSGTCSYVSPVNVVSARRFRDTFSDVGACPPVIFMPLGFAWSFYGGFRP
jgi:hypothetical protein